jgi:hypothetical protein
MPSQDDVNVIDGAQLFIDSLPSAMCQSDHYLGTSSLQISTQTFGSGEDIQELNFVISEEVSNPIIYKA